MRVGVIQMRCNDDGDIESNRSNFERLVAEACHGDNDDEDDGGGANKPELLLGPEFALCGYTYDTEKLWSMAEPQGGPTEKFLCSLSQRYSVYLGISYLEAAVAEDEAEEGEGDEGIHNNKKTTSSSFPCYKDTTTWSEDEKQR